MQSEPSKLLVSSSPAPERQLNGTATDENANGYHPSPESYPNVPLNPNSTRGSTYASIPIPSTCPISPPPGSPFSSTPNPSSLTDYQQQPIFSFSGMSPTEHDSQLLTVLSTTPEEDTSTVPSYHSLQTNPHERQQQAQNERRRRRRRRFWLTLLILPARLAIGALTFIAGARISSTETTDVLESPLSWATGIFATAASQYIVTLTLHRLNLFPSSSFESIHQTTESEIKIQQAAAERMNWLDAIQAVGKIVDRFRQGLGTPQSLQSVRSMFLDVSLARLVHLSTLNRRVTIARARPNSQSQILLQGRHFLDFALASYGFLLLRLTGVIHAEYDITIEGTRGEDVARYLLGLHQDDDIIAAHLDGEEINLPRHFIAIDHTFKCIVVSIRGTNSISDIITDLICSNEKFGKGYAHGGMKAAAETLCASMTPTLLSTLGKYPGYTIVVTGHSLGAGVAILLTKLLINTGLFQGEGMVRCFAFAPCPVFGPLHHVDSEWSDALECFVHADDLVATLCLASARRLVLEIDRIDKKIELDNKQKRDIVNKNHADVIESLINKSRRSVPDPREDEVDQLYIPCHRGIHWLVPHEDDEDEDDDDNDFDDNKIDTERGLRTTLSSGESFDESEGERAVRLYNERWGKEAQEERRKKWKKKVESLQGMVPPAYVPSQKFGSYVVRPRLFEKILVTPSCVNNHFPNLYTSAFAGLDLPPRQRPLPPAPKRNYTSPWYANELG